MPAAANSKHIVVVGAGIIGCSTAYHLLQSGVRKVTLVIVVPQPIPPPGAPAGDASAH